MAFKILTSQERGPCG